MTENSTLLADYRQMSNQNLAIAGVAIAVFSMILEFIVIFNPLRGLSSSVTGDDNVRRRNLPTRKMNRGDYVSKSTERERKQITESSNSKKSRRIQASLT